MHNLLAAFFAMLFSTSHTSSTLTVQQPIAPPPSTYTLSATGHASSRIATPRLQRASSYAERACVSCRRMNVTYRVR